MHAVNALENQIASRLAVSGPNKSPYHGYHLLNYLTICPPPYAVSYKNINHSLHEDFDMNQWVISMHEIELPPTPMEGHKRYLESCA